MVTEESFAHRVTKLGALSDPVRRALYRFVASHPDAVSRDQAASGVEVPRHTAKHHLDKLVEEGLLVTEFRRLTGRSGPGAGRPAKLYRRAAAEVVVSLPQRRYDLAGQVLADAVERSLGGTPMDRAVQEAASAAGVLAADEAEPAEGATGELDRLANVLAKHGYEPRIDGSLLLGNCPFDRLATDHTDLVCGMNLTFVDAVAGRLGCHGLRAELDPDPGLCCVKVHEGVHDAVHEGRDGERP